MGSKIAEGLTARGYTIFNDDSNPNASGEMKLKREAGERVFASPPTNLICWLSVPSHMSGWRTGQHRAFVSMWEAMTLPESFREVFHEIDTMIVPSRQNEELFSRYHPNVHYMPLGVEPELWHYMAPPPVTTEFRFLISGRGGRKGVDLAFKAFREVFRGHTSGPTPKLVMKSMRGHDAPYYAPGVEHITGRLDALIERDLYASCHAYLQPSRGEGFGLQPLQAIALGRPTILTAAHGHEAYAHLGLGIGWDPAPSGEFIWGDAGDWWEPRYDELCEQMWDVYKNYDLHAKVAKTNAEIVGRDFTWSKTVDRFVEILGPHMTKPYSGDGEWHEPVKQLFKVVTYRDFRTEIAGQTLFFEAGKEYYSSADVKRILFDGGILDPACLTDDDVGLAPLQALQLGKYLADREYCQSCQQRLNSGKTRSDDIFDEMTANLDVSQ